jgi:hypothetical protein
MSSGIPKLGSFGHGPKLHYPLLCQRAHGNGIMSTFHFPPFGLRTEGNGTVSKFHFPVFGDPTLGNGTWHYSISLCSATQHSEMELGVISFPWVRRPIAGKCNNDKVPFRSVYGAGIMSKFHYVSERREMEHSNNSISLRLVSDQREMK